MNNDEKIDEDIKQDVEKIQKTFVELANALAALINVMKEQEHTDAEQ